MGLARPPDARCSSRRSAPRPSSASRLNAYAAELARVTIWIGEIQWMIRHGLGYRRDPILKPPRPHREPRRPARPVRPVEAPGGRVARGRVHRREPAVPGRQAPAPRPRRRLRRDALFASSTAACRARPTLSRYWHEKARAQIERGRTRRAGLLATQGIRGGANRRVLERIKETGDIFFARSDEPWVLAGATVHISFVGQDDGTEAERELDGQPVASINAEPDDRGRPDAGASASRRTSASPSWATRRAGRSTSTPASARDMLAAPKPGRPIERRRRPAMGQRPRHHAATTRTCGSSTSASTCPRREAALYEAPFEYVREHVRPVRDRERPARIRRAMVAPRRAAVRNAGGPRRADALHRDARGYSKHRLFVWFDCTTLPDSALVVIARDDDYTFGVLHSRVHELWARAHGHPAPRGRVRLPLHADDHASRPSRSRDPTDEQRERVGEAARRLVELRDGWLNPPGLDPADLEKRTLTNLYNQRPTWLDHAHADLDAAVFAAYGWPADLPDVMSSSASTIPISVGRRSTPN